MIVSSIAVVGGVLAASYSWISLTLRVHAIAYTIHFLRFKPWSYFRSRPASASEIPG